MASPALRWLRAAAALAIATSFGAAALPGTAGAIDTGPRAFYASSVGGPGVQVGGTFTPVVGNFAGDDADDVFWYAPGTAADFLWTTIGPGTFTKESRTVNGTYVPLVGDFAGDDYDDILWYGPGSAGDVLWTSTVGPQAFTSSPLQIGGTYQPVVLDGSIDLAVEATHAAGGLPNDTIIWYRPGPASDLAWGWNTNGSHNSYAVTIEGSPRLVPFNANGDIFEDLLAYTPGAGPDAVYTYDTGALIKTPKIVNGNYQPTVVGNGYLDSILWHGPGGATDAYWANFEWGRLTSAATQPVGGTSAWPARATGGLTGSSAYVYDGNGVDAGFVDGYAIASTDGDIGPGARPFTGDFNGDLGLDTFFYRPGAATDTLRFGGEPVIV